MCGWGWVDEERGAKTLAQGGSKAPGGYWVIGSTVWQARSRSNICKQPKRNQRCLTVKVGRPQAAAAQHSRQSAAVSNYIRNRARGRPTQGEGDMRAAAILPPQSRLSASGTVMHRRSRWRGDHGTLCGPSSHVPAHLCR